MMMRAKLNIGCYIGQLGGGGAERVMTLLANHFAESCGSVYLIANKRVKSEYPVSPNVKVLYLDDTVERNNIIVRNARRLLQLRKACRQNNIDCLISFMAEPNFRALVACSGLNIANIISIRNDPFTEYPGMRIKIAHWLFRRANAAVFQTSDARMVFPELLNKSTVIYNPVDNRFFDVRPNPNSNKIVTAGRLEPQKNHGLLIDAFLRLVSKLPGYSLEIYGDGSLREQLQSKIDGLNLTDKVRLTGYTDDFARVLEDAALFVLSSDYEGMPNALMEAMAAGVPVISTDCPCGGPRELLSDDYQDYLVPVGDTEALTNAMVSVLSSRTDDRADNTKPEERETLRRISPASVFSAWDELVMKVVANSKRGQND